MLCVSLARAIKSAGHEPGYDQEHAGRWQYQIELSARLMQSQRSVRPVPAYQAGSTSPPKCSLMGTYEQMGPDGLDDSRRFWEGDPERDLEGAINRLEVNRVRLRKGERLCAVALVKRFAAPAYLAKQLELEAEDLRFEDTSSVAAAEWYTRHEDLREYAKKQRSSSWLHWARPNQEQDEGEDVVPSAIWGSLKAARDQERPPAYYAILMVDGDEMGAWLRGEKSPRVREVMHPDAVSYFEAPWRGDEERA